MIWKLLPLLLLSGCAGTEPAVEDARAAVRAAGENLERTRAVIIAVCSEPPPAHAMCPQLVRTFNDLQVVYSEINEAMP
jgi:hypothetical protein